MKGPELHAQRLQDLQLLLVKLAEVERHIYFPDGKQPDRRENDVEHSFNLAIAVWYLAPYFPKLDRDKMLRYALAHDFSEVYAGDDMAIGRTKAAQKAKQAREAKALKKLQQDWSDFKELTDHIEAYEAKKDPESRFVYALDKLMPMILNMLTDGKTWRTYKLKRKDVFYSKDSTVPLSPEMVEIWEKLRQQIIDTPSFFAHDTTIKQQD